MSIHVGSRYENATVSRNAVNGQVQTLVIRDLVFEETAEVYVIAEGDRLDLLAHQIFGDSNLWWRIADANPELLLVDPLVPGTTLRIPDARRFS